HAAAILVDEGVGQDLEEPRLHVRAALELIEEAERAQEGVLHQVLGVPLVLRQAQPGGVERVEVLEREAFEFPPRPVGVLEVQHPSPAWRSRPESSWLGYR